MEYLPPDRHELWKSQLARGCVIPETAATVGRQLASIHAAFAKSPDGRRRVRYRRVLPRASHRAVPARDRTRAPRPRFCSRGACRADRANEADRRAWRHQPEEHSHRPVAPKRRSREGGRPDLSRRRVRVVRRSGVRSGFLSQPPAVEDAVDSRLRSASCWRRSTRWRTSYLRGVDWEPAASAGATGRPLASRIVPGACRREVAGRISDG